MFVSDFMHLDYVCGRFYAFRLCLWQIFYASIVFLAGLVCQGIICSLRPNFKSFPRNVELYLLNFMLKHGLVKKTITRDSSILELKFPDDKFIQQTKNFSQTQDT